MKKIKIICLLLLVFLLSACGNKYVGYWCNYSETSTIVILLEDNITDEQRNQIETVVNRYNNLTSLNYISKEDYARDLGESASNIDIYANYFLTFDSMDSIGTYVEELSKMPGVHDAKQSSAKSNITLFNLAKNKTYTYTDSDEPNEKDIEHGKYKIKKGVITLTKENSSDTRLLYIKNNHLCGDSECNIIYASSNESCSETK